MTKTTVAPRIVPSSELNAENGSITDFEWSEELHEPRMFGISGGLSASGGDFGFETAEEADRTDSE